jgi:hypothetical protein
MSDDERPPDETPWGHKQEEWDIGGFWWVSTPRHGGIYLTPNQRKDIPDLIKPHSSDAEGIWWEEDSAWSLPVVYLLSQRPHESLSDEEDYLLERAHNTARDSFPDEWEQMAGREIKQGESYSREDGRDTALVHSDDLLAGTVWRSSSENSWVPEGMVGVAAYPGVCSRNGKNRTLRIGNQSPQGDRNNGHSVVIAQSETDLAFGHGRERLHIFYFPGKAIDILHQHLDNRCRAVVAALQLIDTSSDVFVGRHEFSDAYKCVDHKNAHFDGAVAVQHGRQHDNAVLSECERRIF